VVALHGGTGWGAQFEANSGFSEVAEAHGVVVVYPDGTGVGPENALRTWNAGYCCGSAANQDIDDVEFVRLLLDEIGEGVPIDGDRVYAIGHSNGGMLAYRLACELSDRIVAIALQAGSLGVDRCSPTDPVSVLHLHGVADENHPIDGGVGPRSIAGVDFRSAQSSVEAMARAIGCQEDPIRTSTPPLTRTQWTPCPAGATVELVAVDGAVHAWMGGNARAGGPDQQTNPDDLDVDASVLAWQFLASHSRGG
jgi:polyhydroxybutyrate depolymerase